METTLFGHHISRYSIQLSIPIKFKDTKVISSAFIKIHKKRECTHSGKIGKVMYCFRTFFQYILVCLKVGTKNATLVDHRRPFKEKRFPNESINNLENLHANRFFRRHQNKNGSIFLRICLVQDEPLPLFHIDAIFYFLLIFYLLCS